MHGSTEEGTRKGDRGCPGYFLLCDDAFEKGASINILVNVFVVGLP